ncbi:MAG: carbohydrate porin [Gammaproteobacteria bacterium]
MRAATRQGPALAIALFTALPVPAAEPTMADLLAEIRRLEARLTEIEHRQSSQAAEATADVSPSAPGADVPALAERVEALEAANRRVEQSIADDHISERDPEVVARLKDVEIRTLAVQRQARTIEALEGITAGAQLTMVGQYADEESTFTGEDDSELNYRGDVAVTLPGGEFGNAEGRIFAQFRFGQGNGLSELNPTFTSTPNTTAFALTNGDDSAALLAQAWYQLDVPLPLKGHKPLSKKHLELNFGKIDPFVFFDQNVAADDESTRFLNNVFVHNALLDSGGDMGMDIYGFTPGVRLAYRSDQQDPEWWQASVAAFGAGSGASFDDSFDSPMFVGQLEFGRKFFGGLDGNYRLYAWHNPQAPGFDGLSRTHEGVGLSFDQRVHDAITLFGRYGHALQEGQRTFDKALTLGAEFGGRYWDRSSDAIGVAWGWLDSTDDFQDASATVDADGDGTPDFGYTADGAEQIAEIYYRWQLHSQLDITPDFQLVHNPGANDAADLVKIFGVRVKAAF